ncbi:hypothetical protein PQO03_15775 [Lentisphaera profundi]|uniref:LPXTG cell wall anchor domain-containing protein n=1 Tax=Lentisphaera profundi TaxID=1658616 RepID=A0ABY7W1I8_9BACT|nr:hypothetical protein [Lentisphaera profundi]WDE99295.1 hypothetical protein PQO03_15775 [Lentisphaera profundi]
MNNIIFAHDSFLSHNHQYDNMQIFALVAIFTVGIIAFVAKKKSV